MMMIIIKKEILVLLHLTHSSADWPDKHIQVKKKIEKKPPP